MSNKKVVVLTVLIAIVFSILGFAGGFVGYIYINKAESIPALLDKYQITPEEFLYIGDAVSDFEACCKAGVVCLSAAWADCVDVKMLLQLNPGRVFERVADLETYLKGLLGA